MVDNNSTKEYFSLLKDLTEVMNKLSISVYIWGGLTIDVLKGELQREHHDIDAFCTDLKLKQKELERAFQSIGYKAEYNKAFNFLKIHSDRYHVSINEVKVSKGVVEWSHIGEMGAVYFPEDWLDSEPRSFHDLAVYTAGPKFEYAFKMIAEEINPDWKLREKDKKALAIIREYIESDGMDGCLGRIWSYNPFWIDKGYDPFKPPVLVSPIKEKSYV